MKITKIMKDYDNIIYCHNYGLEPDCDEIIRFVNYCSIKTHGTIDNIIMDYVYNFYENPKINLGVMESLDKLFSKTLEVV